MNFPLLFLIIYNPFLFYFELYHYLFEFNISSLFFFFLSEWFWLSFLKIPVCLVIQLCLTLCETMDFSLPGSFVHGILQARLLEWVAVPFSIGSSWPRDWTQVSCFWRRFFTVWSQGNSWFWLNSICFLMLLSMWVLMPPCDPTSLWLRQ